MKKVLLSLIILLIGAGSLLIPSSMALEASTDEKKVEPNRYEKRKIDIDTGLRNRLIERDPLPEEQQILTFERQEMTKSELLQRDLFQEKATIETNTITAKSDQLNLFLQEKDSVKKRTMDEALETDQSKPVKILLVITVIVFVTLLFTVILPRITTENGK